MAGDERRPPLRPAIGTADDGTTVVEWIVPEGRRGVAIGPDCATWFAVDRSVSGSCVDTDGGDIEAPALARLRAGNARLTAALEAARKGLAEACAALEAADKLRWACESAVTGPLSLDLLAVREASEAYDRARRGER